MLYPVSITTDQRTAPVISPFEMTDGTYPALPPSTPPASGTKVLVVDDEPPIVESVAYNLRKEGYRALTAADADQCLEVVKNERPDLIILDVMLPSASGFDICRILRKQSDVPIIMLTARSDETDKVVGLEVGADDYVTKPFSMRELLARVRTILRRSAPSTAEAAPIALGDIRIDPSRYEVTVSGRPATLSPRAFQLLLFLATHPGRVFTRQALLERIWGEDNLVEERTVDVHVRWLRERIEDDPSHPRHLLTIRGVGYKLIAA